MYDATEPLLLVTGGPGTGKTAVALWAARRELERHSETANKRALFLTFSRSAVAELTSRAPGILAGQLGGQVEIATFHGFAASLIGAHGRYFGRGLEPLTILTDPEEALGLGLPGALRYRELVPTALEMLTSGDWLGDEYASRYAIVVSDEYQDTGSEMAALLDFLSSACRLVCLADIDQMIYETLPGSGVSRARIDALRARAPREVALEHESHRDPTNLIPRVARAFLDRQLGDAAVGEACSAGRLRVVHYEMGPHDAMVTEIQRLAAAGARKIGVFLSQRVMVEEAADRLRDEGIEHEIAGLGAASGYAQKAAAAIARFATDQDTWARVHQMLALFLASSYTLRSTPELARRLAMGEPLPGGLARALDAARDTATAMRGRPISEFLDWTRRSWSEMFVGHRGIKLWELGLDDLVGQTLAWAPVPLDETSANVVASVAAQRHVVAAVDGLPSSPSPVQLMTTHQAKGRELDAIILIHDQRDYTPEVATTRDWIATTRLHYVAISRARETATLMLPPEPKTFFAPYATVCRSAE